MSAHNRSLWGGLNVLLHAFKVETDGLLVKVATPGSEQQAHYTRPHLRIRLDLEAGVFGNGNVVTPCWRGQVDRFGTGVVSGQKGSSNSEGTGSGDRLGRGELRVASARRESQVWQRVVDRVCSSTRAGPVLTLPSTIGFESLP